MGLEEKGYFAVYSFGNVTYNLLWPSNLVTSDSPLGLREFLISSGWIETKTIGSHTAVFIPNTNNVSYGRVAVGVGADVCDTHDPATYHAVPCSKVFAVDEILAPPSV